jgi:hypothetical protein
LDIYSILFSLPFGDPQKLITLRKKLNLKSGSWEKSDKRTREIQPLFRLITHSFIALGDFLTSSGT